MCHTIRARSTIDSVAAVQTDRTLRSTVTGLSLKYHQNSHPTLKKSLKYLQVYQIVRRVPEGLDHP